ncbi:hypothetical protein LEP1GSC190_11465 [Leptospira mayottensis 200901116]|uniref:Uncharacterized protein n=1 Tax=Leptospira mayottensis 200901122 TaxID=1193010 RepID=A0AA87MKI9_9LEPT|nr:hypothetical protein LEP1GSC190_11465 [Leptospira mayottensis 200901116]EKR98851.1 hypothetical protein LEP1GSC125_3880 [Leptospira mayottensis 200901122]
MARVNIFSIHPNSLLKTESLKVDILFSNSMIETVKKIMKYQFLFSKILFSFQEAVHYKIALNPELLAFLNKNSNF